MRRNPAGLNSAVRRPGERKIRSVRLAEADYVRACDRATALGCNFSFYVERLIVTDVAEAERQARIRASFDPAKTATDLAAFDAQKIRGEPHS